MSQLNQIHLAWFDEHKCYHKRVDGKNRELMQCIDTFFTKMEAAKHDIEGIMVVVGSGSFTSTRIGVVVANTWAFAKDIPLLAIQESQIEDIQSLIPTLLDQPKGQYISATYSGEPNIGGK